MTKFDLHQTITDQIVAAIEAGCPPWRKPWTGSTAGAGLPLRHNGEAYRGINILVLWSVAAAQGYTSWAYLLSSLGRLLMVVLRRRAGTRTAWLQHWL